MCVVLSCEVDSKYQLVSNRLNQSKIQAGCFFVTYSRLTFYDNSWNFFYDSWIFCCLHYRAMLWFQAAPSFSFSPDSVISTVMKDFYPREQSFCELVTTVCYLRSLISNPPSIFRQQPTFCSYTVSQRNMKISIFVCWVWWMILVVPVTFKNLLSVIFCQP